MLVVMTASPETSSSTSSSGQATSLPYVCDKWGRVDHVARTSVPLGALSSGVRSNFQGFDVFSLILFPNFDANL